jgi:predicted dehydrogenase
MVMGDAGALYTPVPPPDLGPLNQHTLNLQHHASPLVRVAGSDAYGPIEPNTTGLAGADPYVNEILHFAQCVREGREPLSSGRDNLGTMRAVFAWQESARTGAEVGLATA